MKTLMVVAARDSEMVEDTEKLDFYNAIPELFDRFQGVDLGDKNPLELLVNWTIMAKGIILYSILFRGSLNEEDALTDLMTDLSLHIWGYRKKR